MKHLRKKLGTLALAVVMVVCMLAPAGGLAVDTKAAVNIPAGEGTQQTLFAASFEEGESSALLENTANPARKNQAASMRAERSNGPQATWVGTQNAGWSGASALRVAGNLEKGSESYASCVVYEDLRIPVNTSTVLSYLYFPALVDAQVYDHEWISQYMSVDLLFSDGTYLSDLGARDQNGNLVSPAAQGETKTLYTMQWNQISADIGAVAAGKTIVKILVAFHIPDTSKLQNTAFLGYFDDICIATEQAADYAHLSDYVNILRGVTSTNSFSRGLLSPFVTTPHGFNMFVPVTNEGSNKHYTYQPAGNNGLAHITVDHVSSNWIAEWGTWQFMLNSSIDASSVKKAEEIGASARKAQYSHENEQAKAHYYGVTFNADDARAPGATLEITPTEHAAYARFTFPQAAENRNVIFDCERADGGLTLNKDKRSFTAYSEHTNSNGSTRMYVYGEFDTAYTNSYTKGKQGIVSFAAAQDGETVVGMRFATSYISYAQAEQNLKQEISQTDTFDSVFAAAQRAWDQKLGIIEVEGATFDQLTTLYSGLYRLFSYPIAYSEYTGKGNKDGWQYRSPYGTHKVTDGRMYTINGFWDTYRTTWAAYALFTPQMDTQLLNGLVQHYTDQGAVPRWIAPGGANSMVGTSSDVIFGDAAAKGIPFDKESAFRSTLRNAAVYTSELKLQQGGRRSMNTSVFQGYAKADHEGFSWSMESYTNDWGISQLAKSLGYTDEAAYYQNRAKGYVNLYNDFDGQLKNAGWFMSRNDNGAFRVTNPSAYNPDIWWGDYTETNGWNMAVSVTQDGQGLANLYGGREGLAKRLDAIFEAPSTNNQDGAIHEMKEAREVRMGVYGHSNQPSHHIPYMYTYAGQPYKTQEKVREIMQRLYVGSAIGQGYCGDEDNGEMSAWYIFSALGFYPTNMGSTEYTIGSPLFTKATVTTDNGNKITINAPNNSRENLYVQGVMLNGKAHGKAYFTHADLTAGDVTIDFAMSSEPSAWGTGKADLPSSLTSETQMPQYQKDTLTKGVKTSLSKLGIKSALTDDKSSTQANFVGKSVTFTADYGENNAQTIAMYTVTSGISKGLAPASVKLEASADGKTWVTLDEREDLTFQWARYTRPFAVAEEKQGAYRYYRLVMGADGLSIEVAELEFIAAADPVAITVPGETEPGTHTPTEPGTHTPTEPGTDTPTEPGTDVPTEPGTDVPTEPGTDIPTEPGTEPPTAPGGQTDGTTQGTQTIPKTGDSNALVWAALFGAGVTALCLLLQSRKKRAGDMAH